MKSKLALAPRRFSRHEHGVAAILAMMFLVIFASLATAMAIVSQGNLRTADSHMKINRSLSAAETGMNLVIYRMNQITPTVKTHDGIIDNDNADALWTETSTALVNDLAGDIQYISNAPYLTSGVLYIPATPIRPGSSPTFEATLEPHPLPGENYDSDFYQRPPYSDMSTPVSAASPLDATWIRVTVTGADGAVGARIFRTITMDFQMDKKIRFAILTKSRIMIGRNVMIEGSIGSRFEETYLNNGHPVQIVSDFRGLHSDTSETGLDAQLDALIGTLITNDQDGDNRLSIYNELEVDGIADPASLDINSDGYIDDYDFFLGAFDTDSDQQITLFELESESVSNLAAAQIMELIDTFGDPNRAGYNDGILDSNDRYAKIRGQIKITTDLAGWENGAANGAYQDFLQGPIVPDYNEAATTFESSDTEAFEFNPEDFDVSNFFAMADGDLMTQATDNDANGEGTLDLVNLAREAVPYGAAYPYDYYARPVFRDMTFTNIRIPKGTNGLFINCTFRGVTFVETQVNNFIAHPTDPSINAFNYSGMWDDLAGTAKHPDVDAYFQDLYQATGETSSKDLANNIRFDGCTFEGAIVSSSPLQFSHTRNKLTFTGTTRFVIDDSTYLSESEKALFKRSTLLTPHFSIEMGTFIAPNDDTETIELSGTIVAGVLDMRGQVKINGTILTTFLPESNSGPVIGDTSPQFNTTLGYFPSSAGDLEAELPDNGMGVIQVRYDPTIPMPDGILGPIEITANYATYFEGESN